MERGYLKLWRCLEDKGWANNEGVLCLAIHLLLNAAYKERWITVKKGRGQAEIKLMPGQLVFGRKSWGKKLGQHPSTIWKRIEKLRVDEFCDTESNTNYTLITILNWGMYQGNGNTESNTQVTPESHLSNTQVTQHDKDKNIKNIKNDKKTTTYSSSFFSKIVFSENSVFAKIPEEDINERIEKVGFERVQKDITGLEKAGYGTSIKLKKSPLALLIRATSAVKQWDYITVAEKEKKRLSAKNKAISERLKQERRIKEWESENELKNDEQIYNEAIKDESIVKTAKALLDKDKPGLESSNKIQYDAILKNRIINLYKKAHK